jgi:hypothetical protein
MDTGINIETLKQATEFIAEQMRNDKNV